MTEQMDRRAPIPFLKCLMCRSVLTLNPPDVRWAKSIGIPNEGFICGDCVYTTIRDTWDRMENDDNDDVPE